MRQFSPFRLSGIGGGTYEVIVESYVGKGVSLVVVGVRAMGLFVGETRGGVVGKLSGGDGISSVGIGNIL